MRPKAKRRRRLPSPWAPVAPNSQFIEETREFWEPLYGHPITREDAREIIENVTGFLTIALEWDREDRARALQNASSQTPGTEADNTTNAAR